jgi:peptidoglycan/LPS O-acetylase OafA/YrhL
MATPSSQPAFHLGHRRWLDGLRGVAVLAVLIYHWQLIPGGSFGVDMFFVLSGFLITCLLVEEWRDRGSINLKHFYLRRMLRLWPAFLALLVSSYLYTHLARPTADAVAFRREMIVAACYVANWPTLHQTSMPNLGHTWSLSVEEQFYLLWPVLLAVMLWAGLTRRKILTVVCVGILAAAAWRAFLLGAHPPYGAARTALIARLYAGLDTRADALLCGCLVGLLAVWGLLPKSQRALTALSWAAVASVLGLGYVFLNSTLDHFQFYRGGFTLVALMVAVIIVRLLVAPSRMASGILESAPLVGVGRISYALYLYHLPIGHWFGAERLGWTVPLETLKVAGLSFAAATLSYFCIERPFLRLKDRLHGPRQVSDSAVPPTSVSSPKAA